MSAAPKFTPGPWRLDTVSTSSGSCHRIGPFPGHDAHRPETHACVYADGIRIGVDEALPRAIELAANARLIAVAPLLYETVQDAIWVLRNLLALTSNADVRAQIESKIGEFEAALAKVQP